MEMNVNKEKEAVIVSVKGRMDAVTSVDFEKSVSLLVSKGESHFLVNFSQLDYISSAGLRVILKISRQLKTQNGKIVFAGLQDSVREVFKISGFDTIFKIYETEEEALNG
jgi:anti-anti-sigma factor